MDVEKVPIIGKLNRTLNNLMINFILLAVVVLVLGVAILFFPKVLDVIVSVLLFFSALLFLSIAYNIYSYKKKLTKWFK